MINSSFLYQRKKMIRRNRKFNKFSVIVYIAVRGSSTDMSKCLSENYHLLQVLGQKKSATISKLIIEQAPKSLVKAISKFVTIWSIII